jgi:hypothetical protein
MLKYKNYPILGISAFRYASSACMRPVSMIFKEKALRRFASNFET